MGQQQLLLVILVTIIVGIATVVAINTFGSAADSANVDAVRQDMASIAASAQGFYMKPTMLGGGSRSFENLTYNDMAFAGTTVSNLVGRNDNGVYTIAPAVNGSSFTIAAVPASGGGIGAFVGPDCIAIGVYNPDGAGVLPTECPSDDDD
jgi:Tfp pilus assembly protein PilE